MKKLLLILLICFPFVVDAECNKTKHSEYIEYASRIEYDNSYSKSTNSFNIKLYNVLEDMVVKYDNITYDVINNEVSITNISQGSTANISIFANDGCSSEIRTISITEPYYNIYYGSQLCEGYDELALCSSQFTSVKTTEKLIKMAIDSYNNKIDYKEEEKKEDEGPTLYDKLIDFGLNWGIKILLCIITIVISSAFYNSKLRKIKHGV